MPSTNDSDTTTQQPFNPGSAPASQAQVQKPLTKPADPLPIPTAVREWKNANGRPLKASLEKFTSAEFDTAEFKREDGQVFQIGVNKFSLEDQLFIKKLAEQARGFGQN